MANYREALAEWSTVLAILAAGREYVRQEGYHRGAAESLEQQLAPYGTTAMSARVAAALVAFVESQSAAAGNDERLIGSSECLESLIGKGKRLEGQQSRSGFTKTILAMGAAVVQPTRQYVHQALTQIKTHDVLAWCRDHLGISLQAQRHHAFTTGTKTG